MNAVISLIKGEKQVFKEGVFMFKIIKNVKDILKIYEFLDHSKISFFEIGTGNYLGSLQSIYNITSMTFSKTGSNFIATG